ncbi:unnamed protein product [Paramecium pentaurelia]|uniref:Protein kinase domain-containing protein n=1 Tax=Paramecium pentaurelia TaxID=43138 RepID=A0A8S1V1U2_9CILI|nr:unnamed protein product [Paramecium pentaurelia]CAD8171340.1 unnamed protein product [Paramecium pentaurelia]
MQVLEKIGDGLSSEINKCIINHKQCALKSFKECSRKLREREIKILNSLKHDNIISILEFDQNYNWYTTTLMKIDLHQLIITHGPLQSITIQQILLQLSNALLYMHSIDYVHRDIKLENIMLNSEAKLFIIDFGLSVCLHTSKQYPRHCGTSTYMAPELNQDEKIINSNSLKKTDVFALGVVIFILAYGYPPFTIAIQSKCKFWNTIIQQKWQQFWNYFDKLIKTPTNPDFKDLIQNMLEPDPNKRFTIDQVNKHPFITNQSNLEELKVKLNI